REDVLGEGAQGLVVGALADASLHRVDDALDGVDGAEVRAEHAAEVPLRAEERRAAVRAHVPPVAGDGSLERLPVPGEPLVPRLGQLLLGQLGAPLVAQLDGGRGPRLPTGRLVRAEPLLADEAVAEGVLEVREVPAGLPHLRVHDDRRLEADDVLAGVDHRAPPLVHQVALELDAHRAVVVRAAQTPIDLRALENEAPALAQGHDLLHQLGFFAFGLAHRRPLVAQLGTLNSRGRARPPLLGLPERPRREPGEAGKPLHSSRGSLASRPRRGRWVTPGSDPQWRGDRVAEGTRLLSGRRSKAYRGFKSRPLRQSPNLSPPNSSPRTRIPRAEPRARTQALEAPGWARCVAGSRRSRAWNNGSCPSPRRSREQHGSRSSWFAVAPKSTCWGAPLPVRPMTIASAPSSSAKAHRTWAGSPRTNRGSTSPLASRTNSLIA